MSILELLETIPDPRMEGKVKHNLGSILFVGLCGVLSGCESWSDIEDYCETKFEWLSSYVDLVNGIPSEWTFRRVFTLLDPAHMEQILSAHAANVMKSHGIESDQIALDGKSLKGSKRLDLKCLQSISAWCHENSLVLAETQVEGSKSNEIAAIPLLLEALELKAKTITIDAAGCQKNIARQIKEKKGDYVFGLKKNHPTLYEAAIALKAQEGENDKNRLYDAFDDGHGRLVRRRYFSYDARTLPAIDDWEGAKSLIAVETISSKTNDPSKQVTSQWRYYLSSHSCNNPKLPEYIRHHWGIENKLHWVLDVQFKEDNDQKAERKSTRSFALLRRIALNIVRTRDTTPKRSVRRKLKRSGWDNDYLKGLLLNP
jgi:predicted transposase YbfD/YdcC